MNRVVTVMSKLAFRSECFQEEKITEERKIFTLPPTRPHLLLKATPTSALPMGQVFTHMSLWGIFLFKPPQAGMSEMERGGKGEKERQVVCECVCVCENNGIINVSMQTALVLAIMQRICCGPDLVLIFYFLFLVLAWRLGIA